MKFISEITVLWNILRNQVVLRGLLKTFTLLQLRASVGESFWEADLNVLQLRIEAFDEALDQFTLLPRLTRNIERKCNETRSSRRTAEFANRLHL